MLMYLVMQISFLYIDNYLGKFNDVVMSIVQFMLYNSTQTDPGEQHRRRRKIGDTCKISARDLLLENPLVSGSGEEYGVFRIWKDAQHYTKYLIKIQNGKTQKIEKILKAFKETKMDRQVDISFFVRSLSKTLGSNKYLLFCSVL